MNEANEFQALIDNGQTVYDIWTNYQHAENWHVTEPYIRKRLKLENPLISAEQKRKIAMWDPYLMLSSEILALYEPRYITPDHTAECIEALIRMSDSSQVLELGMYTGYTTLHMMRAIVGKEGAKVVSVESRRAHDEEFFAQPQVAPWFEFIEGWTPECLDQLRGRLFDLVFVDSDHSIDHTEREFEALKPLMHSRTILVFHDAPFDPDRLRSWLLNKVSQGALKGLILPTAPQEDVDKTFGPNNERHRPNLGVFMLP